MERFVAESDAYRQQSVQDLLTLRGKTVVITGTRRTPTSDGLEAIAADIVLLQAVLVVSA
jgi:hypothetical protein